MTEKTTFKAEYTTPRCVVEAAETEKVLMTSVNDWTDDNNPLSF